MRSRSALIGSAVIALVVLVALAAPLIAPGDPLEMKMSERLKGPSELNLLGTDNFGRDLLSRIIYGSQVSLKVGIVAVALSSTIGVLVGAISGYFGGATDSLVMRVVDIFLAFPAILLAIALVAALGASLNNVIIALAVIGWTGYARVVRATILALKEQEFVLAAKTAGAPTWRIILHHLLPNTLAPIIVLSTLGLGGAITAEATLSFLGLGIQPPEPSWGSILNAGLPFLRQAPHMSTYPGLAIMLTVMGFNLLGDGLRDLLDPRLRI